MTILLTEINVRDAYQKYYQNIEQKVFEEIVSKAQPNESTILLPNTKWVLGLYKKNPQETLRDLVFVADCFKIFDRLKALNILTGRSADLNSYSSIWDLMNVTDRFNPNDLEGDNTERKKRLMRSEFIEARTNVKKCYEDERWLVIIPLSYEASAFWGDGTSWCTAYKDSRAYYDDYTSRGPLYINIDKDYGCKYQFHFQSNSFMDEDDNAIDKPVFDEMCATEGLKEFYSTITTPSMYKELSEGEVTAYEIDEHLYDSVYICHKNGDSDDIYDYWNYEYNIVDVDVDEDVNHRMLTYEGFESYDIIRKMNCVKIYIHNKENIVLYSGQQVFEEYADEIVYNEDKKTAIAYYTSKDKYAMSRVANHSCTDLGEFTIEKEIGGGFSIVSLDGEMISLLHHSTCRLMFDWEYVDDAAYDYIERENSLLIWVCDKGIRKYDLDTQETKFCELEDEDVTNVSFFSEETFAVYLEGERKWKLFDVKTLTPKYKGKLFDYVICNSETYNYALICYNNKWNIINPATGKFIFQDMWFDSITPRVIMSHVSDKNSQAILFPSSIGGKKYLISVDGNIYEDSDYKFGGYDLLSKNRFENVKLNLNDIQFILSEAKKMISEISVKDAYVHYQDIPEDVYKWWIVTIQGDNADNAQLDSDTKWVLKCYQNEGDSMFGKAEDIQKAINIFKRMRIRGMLPQGITLEMCSGTDELIAFTNSVNHDEVFARTQKELDRDIKAAKNDIDVVFENDDWYVLTPKSMEASIYWGSKTKWCTATKTIENNRFEQYSENGPLYININKKTGAKYQFSFADSEWNDASNEVIPFPIINNIEGGETLAPFYQQKCTGQLEWAKKPMFELDCQFVNGDWEYCHYLHTEIRQVVQGGKVNFITKEFNYVSNTWFDGIEEMHIRHGFAVVDVGNGYHYFDFLNGISNDSYASFGGFLPMNTWFASDKYSMISSVINHQEKFNLMRGDGKLLLNRWFDEINVDYENRCFIGKLNGETFVFLA